MIQIGNVRAEIRFNYSAIDRLFSEPEEILKDAEGFWESEPALLEARAWHERQAIPLDWDRFRSLVEEIARIPEAKRSTHRAAAVTRRIREEGERFMREGLPHLCKFLPESPVTISFNMLFAGGIVPYAFSGDDAVVDLSHGYWHTKGLSIEGIASWILNVLVHECYHVGYDAFLEKRPDVPSQDTRLHRILDDIQNEGMANYVNYTAQKLFSAPAETDFHMLDEPAQVTEKISMTNAILQARNSLANDELRELIWEDGIQKRAFYVAGSHMARAIDEKAGRRALTDTIMEGSLAFVKAYNRFAEGSLRIRI